METKMIWLRVWGPTICYFTIIAVREVMYWQREKQFRLTQKRTWRDAYNAGWDAGRKAGMWEQKNVKEKS